MCCVSFVYLDRTPRDEEHCLDTSPTLPVGHGLSQSERESTVYWYDLARRNMTVRGTSWYLTTSSQRPQ